MRFPGLSLRPQLAVVSLLMLLLPWAGCQSIQEMESALREGQADALNASMQAVAATLKQQPAQLNSPSTQLATPLVVTQTKQPIIIDGYDDEWHQDNFSWRAFRGFHHGEEVKLLVKLTTDAQKIHLFFRIFDPVNHYYDPQQPEHTYNRIWLYGIDNNQQFIRWQLRAETEGAFLLEKTDDAGVITSREGNAFWRKRQWGYQIELALPLNWVRNGLGFRFFSVANKHDFNPLLLTTGPSAHSAPVPLILPNPQLDQLLAEFAPAGVNLMLLDAQGWKLGAARRHNPKKQQPDPAGYWIMEKLYNLILAREELPQWEDPLDGGRWLSLPNWQTLPYQAWYRDKLFSRQLQLHPITLNDGRQLILAGTQGSERLLSQAGTAFDRLFMVSLLVMVIAGIGLLGYASLLSMRIRRLSQQAENCVAEDGRQLMPFSASNTNDEIGELSRIIAQLLERQGQYTEYLKTLSSKLSHELRTPLAVVSTSLDNLSHETLPNGTQEYLNRAQDGSQRLSQLLSSLSMASRLEQAMQQAEMENVDIAAMLTELLPAYQGIYPHHKLTLSIEPNTSFHTICAPDLLVQLLDKLIDNAADFTPKNGLIHISLKQSKHHFQLGVLNQGSQLPQTMRDHLFDSLVSVRDNHSDKPHLGLGLHIVKLIAQHHLGTIQAENQKQGVLFTLQLPKEGRETFIHGISAGKYE